MNTKRKRKKTAAKADDETIWEGSGNVFADLGLPNPEERLLKAKLTTQITQLIEDKGLTQAQAAERTGLDQPKISRLLSGHLSGFSVDRLLAILNRLGHSVEIRISPNERPRKKSNTRVTIG